MPATHIDSLQIIPDWPAARFVIVPRIIALDAPHTLRCSVSSDGEEVARVEAALMLGELGEHAKSAVEPLKALLADPSPNVRRAAAEALKKLEQ